MQSIELLEANLLQPYTCRGCREADLELLEQARYIFQLEQKLLQEFTGCQPQVKELKLERQEAKVKLKALEARHDDFKQIFALGIDRIYQELQELESQLNLLAIRTS